MKSIRLSGSFLDSYDRLSVRERSRVRRKLDKFAIDEKGSGFSLHDLDRTDCDSSFKSARISDDLRLILAQHGNEYIFLYVGHHDDAYNWAAGKYLDRNSFGAVYIKDNVRLIEAKEAVLRHKELDWLPEQPGLLEKREISRKVLEKLGIESDIAETLLEIKDEDTFLDFIENLPAELAEGLIDLAYGTKSITELYNELSDENIRPDSTFDELLNQKDSKRRFYLVEDIEELRYILNENSDRWKLFLHPRQSALVGRDFNGPVLVEGGPGTGKTVVGIHRAVHLARELGEEGRILFCTFSRKLASYIQVKVNELKEQKQAPDIIEVEGVDRLINRLLNTYNLTDKMVNPDRLKELMEETYVELNLEEEFDFYETEYNEVIQRYNIRSLAEYLNVTRSGRKKRFSAESRKKAWEFFARLLEKKEENNLIDFEDRAHILYQAIEERIVEPIYDSIIVDEAQDLSPCKLKILAGLVKREKNGLFLLSDKNQRIFRMESWRKDTGINIVGRTHYLTVNYRTTKQIREFADKQFLSGKPDDKYFREYKSIYQGPEPVIQAFTCKQEQYRYIVNFIKNYLENGVNAHEIAVISPIERQEIRGVLNYENIRNTVLEGDIYPEPGTGVCISSLQGCKGLEFRIVILANYQDIDSYFLKDIDDEWYNQQKIRQIECLKYVACTRARDELIVTYVE